MTWPQHHQAACFQIALHSCDDCLPAWKDPKRCPAETLCQSLQQSLAAERQLLQKHPKLFVALLQLLHSPDHIVSTSQILRKLVKCYLLQLFCTDPL